MKDKPSVNRMKSKPTLAQVINKVVLLGDAQTLPMLQRQCALLTNEAPVITAMVCIGPMDGLQNACRQPVIQGLDKLLQQAADYRGQVVLLSLPLVMGQTLSNLAQALTQAGLTWRFLPTMQDQLAGRVKLEAIIDTSGASANEPTTAASGDLHLTESSSSPTTSQRINIQPLRTPLWSIDSQALLDRQPHPLDETSIRDLVTGKVVLITGSGGSIGSELARTVCRFGPSRIVLVERAENALFEIDRDLARRYPDIPRATVLHDVTDAPRTLGMLMAQKPNVIFHAAAHKHVPMMEEHPSAAVENNFYGTRSIADAACKVGVGRFVMISSDKAVRPSSVMGATKRLAELYTQYLTGRSDTMFSMVRFGNVLGSACSVLPIWSEQLSRGGPITVTHPGMTRYFMTIPEAAGLVIQSAVYAGSAGGGEVFLLDMGKPIRIVELAQRFVRLQGMEPGRDIAIEFTGIRPGEKLFEELAYESEEMIPTPHPSVRMWKTTRPNAMTMRHVIAAFDRLRGYADGKGRHYWQDVSKKELLDALHSAVPEMVTPAPTGEKAMAAVNVNTLRPAI